MSVSINARRIEAVLPQTQCRQCGFDGCAPYAEALAAGQAAINLCPPGGMAMMHDLAALLNTPLLPLAQADKAAAPKVLAVIDEAACIGCAACIKACPVDAIIGATKQMHTVLADECTGCELCLPPCPVDCIDLQPVADAWLPRARQLADAGLAPRQAAASHAQRRYQRRQARLQRLAAARRAHLAARAAAVVQTPGSSAKLNPADLIAKAMARAQAQQNQRTEATNQADFAQQQIDKAQARATYRRAQRDLRYGSEAEQAAALAWLRAYKAEQEQE